MRRCLERYEGYKLRFVGYFLGGVIVFLMAIMFRKMLREELGFDGEIVLVVGYVIFFCVFREFVENCFEFVIIIVM